MPIFRSTNLACLLLGLLAALAPAHARADLVLGFQPSSAAPGATGDLYITLTNQELNDGTDQDFYINSFTVEPILTNTSGIRFLAADRNMAGSGLAYIFPLNDDANGGLYSYSLFPNSQFIGSDAILANSNPNYAVLAPGATIGLGHASYQIDDSVAPGTVFNVTFGDRGDFTDVVAPDGSSQPIVRYDDGVITAASPTVATPEPSGLVLTTIGGLCLLLTPRRWSKISSLKARCR